MRRRKLAPAEAVALLNALQASDPVLWRRWLVLEWRQEGITEIADVIRAFLRRSLAGLGFTDVTDVLFQLRAMVFKLASAQETDGPGGEQPH